MHHFFGRTKNTTSEAFSEFSPKIMMEVRELKLWK